MAFWGIEVKPGKPYTHLASKDGTSGRLRISQATLAIGTATLKSLVQCNVGDKRPVLLCALLPNKTESLQLDLEFDEAEDVMFSVIGPRGVYLTGYYVGFNRRSNFQDDSESFGEDIANSETMESNRNTDDYEYDDSFINDDEPEPLTPSPVSSSREDDDEEDIFIKKKRNGNGGLKRLKKRYTSIESDDEMSVPESDDEDDFPISYILKNTKSQGPEKKIKKEITAEVEQETKNNDDLDSKDKVVVDLVSDHETTGKGDQPNTSTPSLAEALTESKSKKEKKKQDSSKAEKTTDLLSAQDDQITNKETTTEVTKNNDDNYKLDAVSSRVLRSKHKAATDLVDGEMKGDQPTMSVPSLTEAVTESKSKKEKKKQDSSKEEKTSGVLSAQDDQITYKETTTEVTKNNDDNYKLDAVSSRVLRSKHKAATDLIDGEMKGDQPTMSVPSLTEVMPENKSKKKKKKRDSSKEQGGSDLVAAKEDQKPNDTGAVFDSVEVVPEKNTKPKKRKAREVNNRLAGNKDEDDQAAIDKIGNDCEQFANGDQSNEKKVKKKRRKTRKTQEVDENTNMDVEKENNKSSVTEPEGTKEKSGSGNKKTLSSGLVIEDLVIGGNSKGKVAAAGKKVKVQYVVHLKENGQVIDSTEKSPHKLKLGDKDVIEGLNVGLDGMRVGDKRRITIPPSMSLGYKGTGENVPPNSWLIYDVEMTSIH